MNGNPSATTYLFLDTSGSRILGQIGQGESFEAFSWDTKRDLANRITEFCDEMLASRRVSLKDIQMLGIGSGPGSLTGLRVGMSFMRTLAQVHQKPLIGIDLFSWAVQTLQMKQITGPKTLLVPAFLGHVFQQLICLPFSEAFLVDPQLVPWAQVHDTANALMIRAATNGLVSFEPEARALHQLMMAQSTQAADFQHLLQVKPLYVVPSQPELKLEKRL